MPKKGALRKLGLEDVDEAPREIAFWIAQVNA
jgi:hypothetical protein